MSQELDRLEAQVKATKDAEDSAILLIQGLADQIRAAAGDPAKLQQLETDLRAGAQRLAEAVAANTPHAPPSSAPRPPVP